MSLVEMKQREKFVPGQKQQKAKSDPAIDSAAQAYITNPAKRKFVAGEFSKQVAEGGVDPGALHAALNERLGPVVADGIMAEVQKRVGKVAAAKSDSEPGKVDAKSPDKLVDDFVARIGPEVGIDPAQEKQEAKKAKEETPPEKSGAEKDTPVGGKTSEVMSQVEVPSVSKEEEQAREEVIIAYSALLDQLCLDDFQVNLGAGPVESYLAWLVQTGMANIGELQIICAKLYKAIVEMGYSWIKDLLPGWVESVAKWIIEMGGDINVIGQGIGFFKGNVEVFGESVLKQIITQFGSGEEDEDEAAQKKDDAGAVQASLEQTSSAGEAAAAIQASADTDLNSYM
jgi:hypothetical protein